MFNREDQRTFEERLTVENNHERAHAFAWRRAALKNGTKNSFAIQRLEGDIALISKFYDVRAMVYIFTEMYDELSRLRSELLERSQIAFDEETGKLRYVTTYTRALWQRVCRLPTMQAYFDADMLMANFTFGHFVQQALAAEVLRSKMGPKLAAVQQTPFQGRARLRLPSRFAGPTAMERHIVT